MIPSVEEKKERGEVELGEEAGINQCNNNGLNTSHHEALSTKCGYLMDPRRTLIDTAAPFESVKAAVNMFGGNADWKAHKVLNKERSRSFEQELQKAVQEIPLYQKQIREAEDAKTRVLQELEITKRIAQDLGLLLEESQTAENKMRSPMNAEEELELVESELSTLKNECRQLIKEKNDAQKKMEESVTASKEVQKRVEQLSTELINAKEELDTAQELLSEAENKRLSAEMEWEYQRRDMELQLRKLRQDLKSFEEQIPVKWAKKKKKKQDQDIDYARQELAKSKEDADMVWESSRDLNLKVKAFAKAYRARAVRSVEKSQGVEIPLEEYCALRKKENENNGKVIAAVDKIKDAKKTEAATRGKLEVCFKEMKEGKEALRDATEKAGKAEEEKLAAEQRLTEWRSNENVRCYWKSFDDGKENISEGISDALRVKSAPNPKRQYSIGEEDELPPARKLPLFPRIVMFLARRKARAFSEVKP